jgi:Ataxin-3
MSGLEEVTAMIYHERQQEGSMLCAQHALNSLLRESKSI